MLQVLVIACYFCWTKDMNLCIKFENTSGTFTESPQKPDKSHQISLYLQNQLLLKRMLSI